MMHCNLNTFFNSKPREIYRLILFMVCLVQLNMHKRPICNTDVYNYVVELSKKEGPVLAALQEMNVSNNALISPLPDGKLIYNRTPDARAALYFTNGINIVPHPAFMDNDLAVGLWKTKDTIKQVMVASLYCDREYKKVVTPNLKKLVNYCTQSSTELIVFADANSHSSVWGSHKIDDRGLILEQFILHKNLLVLNRGKMPQVWTYHKNGKDSLIDITFCTQNVSQYLHDW